MKNFKHILITGGAGFIGSNFVHFFSDSYPDCKITVLDKLTYAGSLRNIESVRDKIIFVHGSIENAADVNGAIGGCDAVINFAAETHVDRSLIDSLPFVKTNVEGTAVLLQASVDHKITRFLQISTDEVYGDLVGTDHNSVESDLLLPRSPYAATKAAAEHLAIAHHLSFGLDVVLTRGTNTYGPRQYPEKIIPLFIVNAIENRHLPVYGNGTAVRDYLHVSDHCRAIDVVLRHGLSGEAYNIGTRNEIDGNRVATEVLSVLCRPDNLLKHVRDRPGHDYRYSVNSTKIERLGWSPKVSFESGLQETVGWYKENKSWWKTLNIG